MSLMGCARSSFRNFESFHRNVVDLGEKGIHLILKQYNSCFVTYETPLCFYTQKRNFCSSSKGFKTILKSDDQLEQI